MVYQIGEAGSVAEDDSGVQALTIWSMMAAGMQALARFHYETEERTAGRDGVVGGVGGEANVSSCSCCCRKNQAKATIIHEGVRKDGI